MTEVEVPGLPDIPGLRMRTYEGHADVPEMTRVMNAAVLANDSPEYRPEELVRVWLDHPSSTDPHEDTLLVFIGTS